MIEKTIEVERVEHVISVFGSFDQNLRIIETELGVKVLDRDDQLHISVSMDVKSGYVLPDLAADVRRAVVDAVSTQVGATVSAVDIYIDGIQFED